jgi:hypothetical protein
VTIGRVVAGEPQLVIRQRSRFWSAPFLRVFAPVAAVAVAGVVALLLSGNLVLPLTPSVTLEALAASKGDLFADEQMQRLLLKRHIRVHLTRSGSRAIARANLSGYDFIFPSGRPAANLIKQRVTARGSTAHTSKPFATPLVLATFRQYAETLVAARVATAQPSRFGEPLYYTLDTKKFFALVDSGTTWDKLGIGGQRDANGGTITNGNRVLAHSSNICDSNSGETFTALTALVESGRNTPPTEAEIDGVAKRIQPLLTVQGMHDADLFDSYETPEGKGKAPIAVVYEHQYLNYQVRRQTATGEPDTDRVLLYPDLEMLTDPEYIALTEPAERLGDLLTSDPALQQRAMELGFRVLDPTDGATSEKLWDYLGSHRIPAPDRGGNFTKAELPLLPALEKLITTVGGCPA